MQGANAEGGDGRGHGGFGTEADWCPPQLSRKLKGHCEPVQTKIPLGNYTWQTGNFIAGFRCVPSIELMM